MKKFIFTAAIALFTTGVFAQSSWTAGLTLSALGNHSRFSGGLSDANARFHHDRYGTGHWGVVFRKTLSNHLSIQTGLGFIQYGFEFAIAEDYSLLIKNSHYTTNRIGFGAVNIPAMLIYNFNPNCRNYRWFVAGGLALASGSGKDASLNVIPANENNGQPASADYLSQTTHAGHFTTIAAHWMFGIEKLFKSGRILSAGVVMNKGFTPLASAEVSYNLDGRHYYHTFTNDGSYCGLLITYYFRAFKTKNVSPE